MAAASSERTDWAMSGSIQEHRTVHLMTDSMRVLAAERVY